MTARPVELVGRLEVVRSRRVMLSTTPTQTVLQGQVRVHRILLQEVTTLQRERERRHEKERERFISTLLFKAWFRAGIMSCHIALYKPFVRLTVNQP